MTFLFTLAVPEVSGAPVMAVQYAQALLDAGHEVILLTRRLPKDVDQGVLESMETLGVQVIFMDVFSPVGFLFALRRFRGLIAALDVDCVVGFQQRDRSVAMWLSGHAHVPCVIMALGRHRFVGGRLVRAVKAAVYGRLLRRRADLVLCPSKPVCDEVEHMFGVASSRIRVLRNGIDVEKWPFPRDQDRDVRSRFGVGDDEILFINVARVDPVKGQDVLIRAFQTACESEPNLRLMLVGAVTPGPSEGEMMRFGDSLNRLIGGHPSSARITRPGRIPSVGVALAAADVYVHASRQEGWPLAVIEAMANGLPIIATDCAGEPVGFGELRPGFIVPSESANDLAGALIHAARLTPTERYDMGRRGRELARTYYHLPELRGEFVETLTSLVLQWGP